MSKAISRRDFLKVTGAVGAAGLLAACGGNGGAASSTASSAAEAASVAGLSSDPVTLTMSWWGGESRHNAYQEALKAFSAEHTTITVNPTNMSKDDIDKAVKEAEQFAADDKKKREEVDIRNGADQMVFQTEKMLKENGDKLPADVKSDAEAKLADLKTAVQSGNVDDIKAKQEALSQVFEKMYQAAAAAQQAAGAQPGADAGATNEKPNDDGVVDADFKEV